jgi:putative RNA 2'-phosphotransferase
MEERSRRSLSKFLSLILRHQPDKVGIQLDPQGWVEIEELLSACAKHGKKISKDELIEVVQLCDKQRFSISPGWQKDSCQLRSQHFGST